jgi:hypothetical protein
VSQHFQANPSHHVTRKTAILVGQQDGHGQHVETTLSDTVTEVLWSGFWALFSSLFKKRQRRLAWHDRIQELIHQISVNRPVSQSNLVVQHALGSFDLSVAGAFIINCLNLSDFSFFHHSVLNVPSQLPT